MPPDAPTKGDGSGRRARARSRSNPPPARRLVRWLLDRIIPLPASAMAVRVRERARHSRYFAGCAYMCGVLLGVCWEVPDGVFVGTALVPLVIVLGLLAVLYSVVGVVSALWRIREPGAVALLSLALILLPICFTLPRLPLEIWLTATPWREWYYFDEARARNLGDLCKSALAFENAHPHAELPAELHERARAAGFDDVFVEPNGAYVSLWVGRARVYRAYIYAPEAEQTPDVPGMRRVRRLAGNWWLALDQRD